MGAASAMEVHKTVTIRKRGKLKINIFEPLQRDDGLLMQLAVSATMILTIVDGFHFPTESVDLGFIGVGVRADEREEFDTAVRTDAGEPNFAGVAANGELVQRKVRRISRVSASDTRIVADGERR